MSKNLKFVKITALIVLTFLVLINSSEIAAAQGSSIPVLNKPFPDFTLPSLDGESISLSGFTNKKNVVLVTFRGWVGYW